MAVHPTLGRRLLSVGLVVSGVLFLGMLGFLTVVALTVGRMDLSPYPPEPAELAARREQERFENHILCGSWLFGAGLVVAGVWSWPRSAAPRDPEDVDVA